MRARIALSLAAALMVCALSASGVAAIHEDQLGRHDWYRQYLGRYRAAEFAKKSARVAVASEQNALAALNLRTGDVEWRQIFGEADPLREVRRRRGYLHLPRPLPVRCALRGQPGHRSEG